MGFAGVLNLGNARGTLPRIDKTLCEETIELWCYSIWLHVSTNELVKWKALNEEFANDQFRVRASRTITIAVERNIGFGAPIVVRSWEKISLYRARDTRQRSMFVHKIRAKTERLQADARYFSFCDFFPLLFSFQFLSSSGLINNGEFKIRNKKSEQCPGETKRLRSR